MLNIDSYKMKMGRWGRGQENRMKLFSGSVSTGLQLSSAFVIYYRGQSSLKSILSQAKTNPSERESDLGWIALPSLLPNGNGTQM